MFTQHPDVAADSYSILMRLLLTANALAELLVLRVTLGAVR
jgi:hypothetical protein